MNGEAAAGALLRAFASVLELEQQALVAGDAPAIEALAREKAAYVGQLASLAWNAEQARAHAALLARLRSVNEENGRLIAWRAGRLGDRLAALGAAAEGTTYDAGGYARPQISRTRRATAFD